MPPKHTSPPRTRKGDAASSQPDPVPTQPDVTVQAAIAAVPIIQPPPENPEHTVTYGTLNSKDPTFFLKASNPILRQILSTVPADKARSIPSSAPKDTLLNEIFRVRQEEALATLIPSVPTKAALSKLMKMSPQDLISLRQSDPENLRSLMHAALVADPTLSPRNFSLSHSEDLATTVVAWQLQSYKKAHSFQHNATPLPDDAPPQHRRVRFQQDAPSTVVEPAATTTNPAPPQTLASILQQDLSPLPPAASHLQNGDDSSEDSDGGERTTKKNKSDIVPANFGYGAGSAVKKLIRSPYPGKGYSPNNLNVTKLRGARILCNFIAQGIDIPTFLFHFKWRRSATNNPSPAEIEADTLGRIIHLEMLTCQTPEQALQTRPSLEVALRQLHAILYVEQSMMDGTYTDKGLAWKNIEFFLETHPTASVLCGEISEDIARRIALEKKHITAVKSMEQARAASRKRSNNNRQHSPGHTPPAASPKKHLFRR